MWLNFLAALLAVILRLDRRIQNARPGIDKNFFQPMKRLLDGPVKPDHDESETIDAKYEAFALIVFRRYLAFGREMTKIRYFSLKCEMNKYK